MATAAGQSEIKNPKTGMSHAVMKDFIRNHFEEFVNRKNLHIGEVNFSPGFVDHGADVPPRICRRDLRGRSSTSVPRSKSSRPQGDHRRHRSEEHTSELQSPCNLVCR